MSCPNCGKKVDPNSARCSFCGIAINNNDNQKIKSIIGIDINNLNKGDINFHQSESQISKTPKEHKLDLKLIINILLIIIVIILSLFLIFMKSKKCPIAPACPVCEASKPCINANEKKSYYVITENYEVFLPNNWQYQKKENILSIYQDNLKINILGTQNGIINQYGNIENKLKSQYEKLAIDNVKVNTRILNNHNCIEIAYQKDNSYYRDFYYQINSNSFIYGQMNSPEENLLINNSNIDDIIKSIKVISNSNIEMNNLDYEEILKAFK